MDSLNAVIKAMYFDYPIADVYGMTVEGLHWDKFLPGFAKLAKDGSYGIDQRQMDGFVQSYKSDLNGRKYRDENDIQLFVGLPLIFAEGKIVKNDAGEPCVEFKDLQSWRNVVKCTGEDLFTTSFLAEEAGSVRKDFCWPNVIGHNNGEINKALDKGVSDIHSHFGGAIDSFMFNWLCLMNDVGELYDKFKSMGESLNPIKVINAGFSFAEMPSWCRMAAAIRIYLYKILFEGKSYNAEKVKSELQAIKKGGSEELTRLKRDIDTLRSEAKQTCDGATLDYAIGEELVTEENERSPYCFYTGERHLEYAFFKEYFSKQSKMKGLWVELFYLYELIKTHLRKEFICANEEVGLDNFVGFNARAALFTKRIEPLCNISAMQTSLRPGYVDFVETRVTSNALGLTQGEYWKGVYSREPFVEKDEMRKRLTFVIQLTKGVLAENEKHTNGRYHKKLEAVHDEYVKVANHIGGGQSAYEIVGLDVGGVELYYRPEVFAHTLRAAKREGLQTTYHVGEEFYDIADGMRAVWEIIQFTETYPVDRHGHCMALGMNAEHYYKDGCNLSMPRQVMLDNIVWLCCFAKAQGIKIKRSLFASLKALAEDLYEKTGYGEYFEWLDMNDYYESMLLRSDEDYPSDGLDTWSQTEVLNSERAVKARENENAGRLNWAYRHEEKVLENGEEMEDWEMDRSYPELVGKVQQKMIEMIRAAKICIEACPSSNLQICNLESYDRHPAIRYYIDRGKCWFWSFTPKNEMNLAICTDDKGTFGTSLVNEFSLLAAAAAGGRGWSSNLEKRFGSLIAKGRENRFNP